MRILHVANFAYNKHGYAFYNCDRKISAGFVRNGHFVYEFSLRDMARMGTVFRSKRFGAPWANAEILRICGQMRPEMVLLGHADVLFPDTLRRIRELLPDTRIAQWYVDPLFVPGKTNFIRAFAPYLDAVFATTGGEWLEQLTPPTLLRGYLPNPVDPAIERLTNFRQQAFPYELIYCGTVGDDLARERFMQNLLHSLSDMPVRLHGLLGQPKVNGNCYAEALASARMGLNHSRRNDVTLYSSDRIAQLTGNGLLTLSPRIPGFESLYRTDEICYFDTLDELVDNVRYYHRNPELAAAKAAAGWRRAHQSYGAERIARFIEEATFRQPYSEPYEWLAHVFNPSPATIPALSTARHSAAWSQAR